MPEFETPKRASLDDLKDIIKAYYIEGAHNEAVHTDDVEATSSLGDKVGRQTNFLAQIGVIRKEGYERRLTKDGESIAEALMGGNESLAQSLMREALLDWELTSKITGFVRMQDPEAVGQERLIEYISANVDRSDDRGKETLLDLYDWADILNKGEEGYTLADRSKEEPDEDKEDETTKEEFDEKPEPGEKQFDIEKIGRADFRINLEISPEDNPDEIERVILAARRALRKELNEDDGQ